MTPAVRYPAGPITPHGAYHILHNRVPQMALRAYDDSVVLNMMGGLAIADPTMPERVELKDLKGLIPPWQTIDQKGATEDGTTFIDALYDPIEVTLEVVAHGRNPAYARKVGRHLIESLDAKRQSELSFTTHDLGRWWAPIRWFKTPDNSFRGGAVKRQPFSLRVRADNGFWRSYDNIADFAFTYEADTDTFNFVDAAALGAGWTLVYTGPGAGHLAANGDQAVWIDSGTAQRTVVARRVGFTSTTNNQVVNVVIGTLQEWRWLENAYNDIWARMNNTGTAGSSGVRLRVSSGFIRLSYFVGGVETVLREFGIFDWQTWIPPLPGEKFTLIAGFEGNERTFKVLRNGSEVMAVTEVGTGSPLGASNRKAGFGMVAGAGVPDQASPAALRKWSAGDNATVSQVGFLPRVNMGDQPFWDRYNCFGPGIFRFGNGPGSSDMVEFGPLLENQVMQVRTDPRKRGVVDLTSIPPTAQELDFFQQALKDFISFATGNNVPPLLQAIESQFGITPPQGNPYSLLKGRWSNPVPAKSPGRPALVYHTRVEIANGNANSRVIAAGTPLRRFPY